VRFSTGQHPIPVLEAWLATTATVTLQDKFTFSGSTYRIVDVERPPDETGVHHCKLVLGR
jgi:hypothetical protein